ncbi:MULTISPECIES: DUF2493 domain-containing protein [Sphingomonas]|uniref:YspA cpYpsA-related SLOG domain-containing protein n=1 Tax=Sphingomonas turrisvirgatae TaxID=1888892 RepID=A0A1E3LRN2_9SPHN|nr:DUF2493 domain-containing protein [Sphingomonas turrisvirgatae]ODP36397.1 hypothetical protein BFL28_06655 [Sphingomonas turrisvirgatae]
MTKLARSIRSFTEIADLIIAETAAPSDGFATAFTETIDGFRIDAGTDVTDAGMPDAREVELATEMLVRTLFDVLRDSRLESLADRFAWGIVHSFHRVSGQLDGEADKAATRIKALIRDADGSEVMMAELEEAQLHCQSLDEARDAAACMRDHAAATYHAETGRPWSSPRGSLVSSKRTASVVAAADFLAARRQRKNEAHAPQGPVVIFSGGQAWEDCGQLIDALDQVRARIPSMVLATTAQDKGCDAIAAAWAARTGTPLIAFTLNRKLGQRAGFARNEQLLALKPVEALVCEGSGLQSHLARLVRAAGVPARFFRLAGQRRHAG